MLTAMHSAGQSNRSQMQARAVLSVVMSAAAEDDLAEFNPANTARKINLDDFEPLSAEKDVKVVNSSNST